MVWHLLIELSVKYFQSLYKGPPMRNYSLMLCLTTLFVILTLANYPSAWAAEVNSSAAATSSTEKPETDNKSAIASQPPSLPPYFSGTNADSTKPTWPDPTGGAAGTWATPAGDGKGDIPSKRSVPAIFTTASPITCFRSTWFGC